MNSFQDEGLAYNLPFPGQVFDGQAGLHYHYFREYDPATARYLQSDPLGVAVSVSTYANVDADTIHHTGPSGLAKCTYSILQLMHFERWFGEGSRRA